MARRKPKTPDQIAADNLARKRRDFEAVNLPADAADLATHDQIEVTRAGDQREGQKVKEDSARRLDAFAALKDGMAKGAYDAARRLERDLLARRGEGDKGARSERVDCESPKDLVDLIVIAGQDCDYVQGRLSRRDWWLLNVLIQPTIERPHWRDHVFYITGEVHPNSQGAAVRAACTNLRDAYEELDVAPRKAA